MPLALVGRLVAQRRVPAAAVVEGLDVIEKRGARLSVRSEALSSEVRLQRREEALRRGVVGGAYAPPWQLPRRLIDATKP